MGTLMGHVIPGSMFISFASWWLYSIFFRYFTARKFSPPGETYRNTCTFPCSCCPKIPMEPIVKLAAVVFGIMGELYTGFENGEWAHMENAQHISMYFFFGFTGLIDTFYFYRFQLPPNLDYVSGVMAFSVEALLFIHHLHGRSSMDIQVHLFLVYAIVACAVSLALEMRYKSNVVPALSRTFFTLLQGTWFYQVGFMLYPPGGWPIWDQESHRQMMLATLLFTWHMAALAGLFLALGSLVYWRVKLLPQPTPSYRQLANREASYKTNGAVMELDSTTFMQMAADSDDSQDV